MNASSPLSWMKAAATPDQRSHVHWLRSGKPDAIAFTALMVHGIDLATYRCPTHDCGLPFSYPHGLCQGCRRPHQRVCASSGCGEVIPRPARLGEDVPPYCVPCESSAARRMRAKCFAGSAIPPRERQTAQSWAGPKSQQANGVQFVEEWLTQPVWTRRMDLAGIDAMYIGGRAGRGKSVLAAYAVHRAYVDLGLVNVFHWESQTSLFQLFLEQFASGTDASGNRAENALSRWRALNDSPLLVLDDLFAKALSPSFGEALSSLIRDRLDQRRATIFTSNLPSAWHEHFAGDVGRLASRWTRAGEDITITGSDLRNPTA